MYRQKIIPAHSCSWLWCPLSFCKWITPTYIPVLENISHHIHTAEITLQLCRFVIKYCTWMTRRRRMNGWHLPTLHLTKTTMFHRCFCACLCVCFRVCADLVWFPPLFCRWGRRATTPRRWWQWRGRWPNTWSSFSRSLSSVASPTAAENSRGQRKDIWGGQQYIHTQGWKLSNTHLTLKAQTHQRDLKELAVTIVILPHVACVLA